MVSHDLSNIKSEVGPDGIIISAEDVRKNRKKNGECEECGTKCYKIKIFGKMPLTVPGKVDAGKCLVCLPQVKVATILSRNNSDPGRNNSDPGRRKPARRTSAQSSSLITRSNRSSDVSVKTNKEHVLSPSVQSLNTRRSLDLSVKTNKEHVESPPRRASTQSSTRSVQSLNTRSNRSLDVLVETNKEHVESLTVSEMSSIVNGSEMDVQRKLHNCDSGISSVSDTSDQQHNVGCSPPVTTRHDSVSTNTFTSTVYAKVAANIMIERQNERRCIVEPPHDTNHNSDSQSFDLNKSPSSIQSDLIVPRESNMISNTKLGFNPNVDLENPRIVMKTLERNLSSVLVQERALKALLNFELSQTDKLEIVNNGGIRIVIAGMEHHESSYDIQLNACKILWKFSLLPDSPAVISEEGGIRLVVNAMERFPEDVEIQESSLSILSSLGLVESLLMSGGIRSSINAMNRHAESGQVQTSGCVILSSTKLLDDDIRDNIGEIGGVEAATFALLMNPGDKRIVIKALSAICDLCINHDRNMDRVNSVEGIDGIISIMHLHRNDSDIQEAGAQAFSNFGTNNRNRYILRQNGGLDVLILSIINHIEHLGVQECASNALWVLSMEDECCNTIIELGGTQAAIEALQKHTGNSKIVENVFSLLSNLASKDQISKVNIVAEAIDNIVMVMMLHSENMNIQSKSCALLRELVCESNIELIMASHVSECMVCASATFPEQCQQDTDYVLSIIQ